MDIAAAMALRYKGIAFPNPTVAALLVKDDNILAKSITGENGSPHAEISLFQKLSQSEIEGGDLYVTLEPCSHQGKNPPCADAIIKHGIKRVFYGILDPNPLVNGYGIKKLAEAGIEVENITTEKVKRAHKEFCYFHLNKRPYVRLKLALSQDYKTAYKENTEKWITSLGSRSNVHIDRYKADAILTGIKTVLSDNPRLDVRLNGLQKSSQIIFLLDSNLKVPLNCNLVNAARDGKQDLVIFTGQDILDRKKQHLESFGIKVMQTPLNQERKIDLSRVIDYCEKHKISNLYVEAGKTLADEFINKKIVNELIIYQSAKILAERGEKEFMIPDLAKLDSVSIIENDTKKVFLL